MSDQKADYEVLFEDELEFTTEKVIRINGDYFHVVENGGLRGAWQNRTNKATVIDVTEARRLALEMGKDYPDICQKTGATK